MLCASGCESEESWKDLLLGDMPDSLEEPMLLLPAK